MYLKLINHRYFFICSLIIILGFYENLYTQSSNRFFDSGTEITIDYLPENDFFYIHVMDRGISLYSLAQVFQVPLEVVYKKNNMSPKTPTNTGKIVKIPLALHRVQLRKPNDKNYYILQYTVKKKQTLYSIAKDFKLSVQKIKDLNGKTSDSLNEGESLTIGYYVINELAAIKHETEAPIKKFQLSDVLGFWDKNSTNESLFVLHNDAKIGSLMDIHNPMLKRHTKAKVIGRIPQKTYPADIEIILSPKCAKIMGILDTRFKVNIKYEM